VSSHFSRGFFLTRFVTPHPHLDNRNHPPTHNHTYAHKFLRPGRIFILRPTYNTDLPNYYTCLPTPTFIISIPQTFTARGACFDSIPEDLFIFLLSATFRVCTLPGYQPHTSPLSPLSLSFSISLVRVCNNIIYTHDCTSLVVPKGRRSPWSHMNKADIIIIIILD